MPQIASLFSNAKEYPRTEGRIKGTLPEWVEGIFIKNGPGIFDLDNGRWSLNHFFDGFAMICSFEIKTVKNVKKVIFQQKILHTDAYKKALIAKRNVYAEFGTRAHADPTKGYFSKVITKLIPIDLTDNTVGNSYVLEGEVFTAYESCFIYNINVDQLLRKDKFSYLDSFGTMMMCAHPLTDSDGVTWNVGASMTSGLKYYILRTPPSRTGKASDALKNSKIFTTIASSWKTCVSYFHSFSMTKNYIIFMEQPMLINVVKLAQMGIKQKSLRDAFEWVPTEKNRIHLLEKSTGNLVKMKYKTEDPYFSFHFANSFELDDQIVVDMITYPSPLIIDKFNLCKLRQDIFVQDDPAQLHRFILPIIGDHHTTFPENENLVKMNGIEEASAILRKDVIILRPHPMAPAGMEFPRFNSRHLTKPYRYLYATGSYDEGFYRNSICKIDLNSGKQLLHRSSREDEFFGEPVFIPKPDKDTDEDDGVVLATVSCGDKKRSDYLILLDAVSFQEIARAEFDAKFLQTLHGTFMCSHELKICDTN